MEASPGKGLRERLLLHGVAAPWHVGRVQTLVAAFLDHPVDRVEGHGCIRSGAAVKPKGASLHRGRGPLAEGPQPPSRVYSCGNRALLRRLRSRVFGPENRARQLSSEAPFTAAITARASRWPRAGALRTRALGSGPQLCVQGCKHSILACSRQQGGPEPSVSVALRPPRALVSGTVNAGRGPSALGLR